MDDHLRQGLARFADRYHQLRIEEELGMSFDSLYDSVRDVNQDLRFLERQINDILYGKTPLDFASCWHNLA